MARKYIIEYLPVAQTDLFEIFDYIRKDDPDSAGDFVKRMDEVVRQLATFPEMGVVPRDARLGSMGYRMLVIDPYLVFYVVRDGLVEVRRILHGCRKFSFLL